MRKNKAKSIELVPKDSPLKQDLLKSEQAAIDAGLVYDPKALEESGTYAAPFKFKGISSYYPDLPKGYYDKYEDYIDKNTLRGRQNSLEDLNSLRADYQSNWEQAGNAIARVATNIIPQAISGFASMIDIPGYFDAEHAVSNEIVNWAMDAKKTVDEDWFPIYEESPGQSMQMDDFAWWMSRGSGLVESIGSFLIQGYGMGKLISAGVKGLGQLTQGKKLATAILGGDGSKRLYAGTAGLLNAVALNQSEAVLEATQVFRDTYQEQFKKNGGDQAKAKQAASIAAATSMKVNKVNILLNLTSASAFITPLKGTRTLFSLPTAKKVWSRVGLEAGQEATEELVNLAAQKAGMAAGRGKDYSVDQAIEDITTMEGLEAAFLGAIGGAMQTGGTQALRYSKYGPGSTTDEAGNKISAVENERRQYAAQQEVLDDLRKKGVKTTDVLQNFKDQLVFQEKLRAANERGDVAEMERLKEDMFENQALKAFRSGTTEVLENLYKHEASRPVEEVGQEYIDRANQAIKNLQELEKVYNNYEEYANSEEVFFNRANKIRAERANNELQNLKKEVDLQFSKDVKEVADKYSFENEKEVLFKKEGVVTETEKRTEQSPLIYSTSDIENNTGDTEKNKEIYNRFLNEVKQLPSYETAKAYGQQAEELSTILRNNEKEFKEITSKKYQQKVRTERAEAARMTQMQEELKNATDIATVENLKNSTENAEFKKQADAKINELKIKNAQVAKDKELSLTLAKFDQKIKTTDLENLDALREEIEQAELSRADKDNLLERVNIQAARLNGEDTTLEEEISGGDPLSAFTQGPDEIENEVKSETESFDTTIPPDYPNPDKETSSVELGVAESAQKLLESDQSAVTGQDEQGNLTYNFQRPEEGYNRGAFLSREFNQKEEVGSVDREEITNSLDNIQLLDPDFLTAGTEVEMQVDKDYVGEKYDPESNTRETISWALREAELRNKAAEQGIALTELEEYIAEVPIKVTLPGSSNSVFYVHDNAWYRAENLSGSEEKIAMDKARNFAIRKAIITKGIVKTKIEYKSFGRLFKSFDGKAISVSEAMPDPNLILAVGKDQGFQLPGEAETLLGEDGKILPSTPQDGRVYAIVKVGPKEFIPIPLERTKLTEQHAKSIIFAVEAHLSQDKNNPVVKAIAESDLGLDITDWEGLNQYIRQFVYLFPTEAAGLEPFLIRGGQGKSQLKSKNPLLAVTPTGIEFGKPSVENGSYTKKDGTKVVQFAGIISKNWNNTQDGKLRNAQMLVKLEAMLKNMMSNADRNLLATNKKAVVILNRDGETSSMRYSELVKQTHKTNILSVNTGTEEAPKWAYTIQPTILFNTSFADFKNLKPATVAKAKPKATPTMPTVTQPVSQPTVSAETIETIETKKADIENKKAEIEKLEKEKEQLLSTQQESQPYTPKAVTGYTGVFWETTSDKKTNKSFYRLEKDSENSNNGLLYFDPELSMSFTGAINSRTSVIQKYFDEANEFDFNTVKGIRTIKPAVVQKSPNGTIQVVEKGIIEYVNIPMKDSSLSRPSIGATTKVDTAEVDAKINKAKEELAALEQQPTVTSDASSVLQVLNIPTNTILEEGKNVTMLDNGDIIPQNRKEGLAAAFGLVPVVESKATLSEEEYNNKVKEAKENAPVLYQILGLPSQERIDLLSDVAAEVSAQVRLEEIEKLLIQTKSVERTLDKITTVYRDGKISFPSPSQMQFLIAKAVELGLPIPPISTLYENSIKLLHRTELSEDPYNTIYYTALEVLKSRYAAFERLGTSEEQLLEMGYPPLQDSYTLEQLQAFAKVELAKIKKSNSTDYAQWEKGGTSTSLIYKDYKALKDILAPNISSLNENNKNLILRQNIERIESVQFIKDLERAYSEGEVVTPKSIETTTPEAEVAETVDKNQVEKNAEEILTDPTVTPEQIDIFLDNILEGAIPEQVLKDAGFADKQQAIDSYQRAKELFIERASQTKTITLPNGKKITIDKNTKDATNVGEDFSDIDDMIAPLSESEIASIRTEIDNLVIRGIDPATQRSLVHFIASDIIKQTLAAKNKGGKQTVKVGPIFEKHRESFKQLAGFYQEAGLVNKAARLEAVVDQFDKLKNLVNQHMSLLTVGSVTEDVTMNDSEEALGLEKLVYTDDWAFTISSKATSSADLKKFFSSIQDRNENGEPLDNILGLPEILPYDVAYDTLHEILANRPADYDHMLEVMDLYKAKFPWIESVIEDLEAAPEKIQNEFVSDMAKHHIDMQFVMWSRDMNGNYSLQKWSSNKSSTEQRIRAIWKSNLKGVATQSNLVEINDKDEYIFDQAVAKDLINQANNWKKNPKDVTNDELANWLGQFGIVISDDTYNDLRQGRYSNKGRKTWEGLFLSDSGLVNVLAKELEKKQDLTVADAELLNDSAIKALASLEAGNSLNTFSNSFQAGGKTIYSYGNNNYLVNRMRDLTAYNSETEEFVNQDLIDKLKSISFIKDSLWLNELTSDKTIGKATRNTFSLSYLSLEALKKKWSDSQDNRKLNNLTAAEHEVTKLGFFQNKSGSVIDNVSRRQVSFFYPTMSDKTTMLVINALAREFLLEDGKVSKKNFETLYDAVVTPEIKRMRDKQSTNISGYEPNYFYFLPSLNTLEIMLEDGNTMTFRDIVINGDDKLYSAEVKEAVVQEIERVFNELIASKIEDWKKLGIGEAIKDDKGKVIEQFPFMDKEYMKWVAKTGKDITKVQYAAMDYVFNYMIANAESFKLFAGDPALYAKFKANKSLQENLDETFVNIGKRLAGDIAPGIELANSVNNRYYQVFLQDKKIDSNNTKDSVQKEFFDKIMKDYSKNYSGIEGSDAQEYTTWKEHLYVLKQLGRLTDAQYNSFKTKLEAQSKGIFNSTTKLSFEELGMVMQPIKPVYVGNIASLEDNADRRVYVKSSSFPLLPELTAGLQIDKIRQGLETFEQSVSKEVGPDGSAPFVRASFGTANKVGAVKNTLEVFDNDGKVVNNLSVKPENTLLLSRANFRIQQDVPYKRDKSEINRGTQETKLLFADMLDVEIEDGVTGADLMNQYNEAYQDLFLYAKDKLARQLGLTQTVTYEENFESLLSIPEPVLFDKAAELEERLSKASPIEKVSIQQDFADEVGEDTLERVNFINKNFDKIVEQLAKAKMNFFFDEETDTNKKCD